MAQEDKEYLWNESDWEKVNGNDLPNDNSGARVVPTYDSGSATPEPPTQAHWYERVFKDENKDLDLSEDERSRLRRRERAERTIAGLGDLGAHIANVWGAANNATPVKVDKTMSDAYAAKWKEMGLDYDERKKAYRTGLSTARKMDYQQYLNDRKQYLAELKEERTRAEKEYDNAIKEARAAKMYADIARQSGESEAKIKYYESLEAENKEKAAYWRARALMPYAPKSSSSGRSQKYYNGTPYQNQQEYNALVLNRAQELGVQTGYHDAFGKWYNYPISKIQAEINKKEKQNQAKPATPSGNGASEKKPNPMK